MIRGTTPDYILRIGGVDLSDKTIFVTIAQGTKKITLTGDELGVSVEGGTSVIAVRLTQAQTLGLREGTAQVQVRFIDSEGTARATNIAPLTVSAVLLERVIEYAGND